MTENCKLDGKIEEIERLLHDATTEKEKLSTRLKELKEERENSSIHKQLLDVFKEYDWYGAYAVEKNKHASNRINIRLNPRARIGLDGPIGGVTKLGYFIRQISEWQKIKYGTSREIDVPTLIVLEKLT